jgi:hypothetical protein
VNGDVAEALLSSAAPDVNYGASGSLTDGMTSGTQRDGLLRFDLSALPSDIRVTSATATLTVLVSSGTAEVSRAHRAMVPWVESTVTWNSFNGAYNAQTEAVFPLEHRTG